MWPTRCWTESRIDPPSFPRARRRGSLRRACGPCLAFFPARAWKSAVRHLKRLQVIVLSRVRVGEGDPFGFQIQVGRSFPRAAHIKRRKQIWEALHPVESGTTCPTLSKPTTGRGNTQFAADTAAVSGESKRDVDRQPQGAKNLHFWLHGGYMRQKTTPMQTTDKKKAPATSRCKCLFSLLFWRRERDSNPRYRRTCMPDFESGAFDHSAISPWSVHSAARMLQETDDFTCK